MEKISSYKQSQSISENLTTDSLREEEKGKCVNFNDHSPKLSESNCSLGSKVTGQVWMPAFFTLAVDPSFSPNGKSLEKNLHVEQLVKTDLNFFLNFPRWVKQIIHYVKNYLSSSQKDWRIYTCLQDLKKIEEEWNLIAKSTGITYAPNTEEGAIWQPNAFYLFQMKEKQFYDKLSEIMGLVSGGEGKNRMFPSELFLPIHKLYAPQTPSWSIENILESAKRGEEIENLDLVRIAGFGYQMFSKEQGADTYIPHSVFANEIKSHADALITAVRELRSALREEKNYNEYQILFNELKTCWDGYIGSSPALQKVSKLYVNNNFFKDLYAFLEKNTQEILHPRSSKPEYFIEKFKVPFDEHEKMGYRKVKEAFNKLSSNSSTAEDG